MRSLEDTAPRKGMRVLSRQQAVWTVCAAAHSVAGRKCAEGVCGVSFAEGNVVHQWKWSVRHSRGQVLAVDFAGAVGGEPDSMRGLPQRERR